MPRFYYIVFSTLNGLDFLSSLNHPNIEPLYTKHTMFVADKTKYSALRYRNI